MEHSYYKDKLSAYFDSALEVQEMELLRRHLEGCAECRELLEKLSSLSQKIEELSGLNENEYFDSLAAKIDNRIAVTDSKVVELPRKEFHRFGFGWKIGAVAASFMLIATVTYYQWQDHESILDEIIQQSTKPAQSVEVLMDSVVESKARSKTAIVAAEKADDKAVTTRLNEIEKDVPAAVGESKAKAAPKVIVKPPELQEITKFETSSQSIVKSAPVLKQEQAKENEPKGDIAEAYVA
ncbi:MAG: zf-HC2 domain-containing protein, partial [candidate division Zixibacteria bacterium]|nr:zf-HC2 domain-containing protein [candidate division Zixibacteria bacterium]